MRDPFVFDPRSEFCKKPYGAVPCGIAVSYTVRPLCSEGWSRCVLVAQREFSNLETETELPCTGIDGDRNRFSGTFPAPAEPELVWYWFRL
ncbi:MAG: glycoside hydrolase family 13 protein, partial [Clostridiales bacterium]|nr:glycoside hydrolase family 13 protein [Clostridiales bacterium]